MSSIRSILEEVAQMGSEYANFGSPFNTDDDNIAGAEALYQTTIDQALKEISELIDGAKPSDLVSYPNSDDEWFREVRTYNTVTSDYQSNLKELLK